MVTPIWMTGFGPQSVAGASNYQLWNTVAGDVSIDSTILRGGRPTLRLNSTATLSARATKVYPTPAAVIVGKRAVRLDAAPATSQVEFFELNMTAGYSARIGYYNGRFRARFDSGQVGVVSDASWVPGAFHVIEYRVNAGASPMTIDWQVDGVEQTQVVDGGGQATSTVASTTFGPPSADQVVLNFADPVDSATDADYPIGDSSVITLMPDSATATGATGAFEMTTDGATFTTVPPGDPTPVLADQPTNTPGSCVRQAIAGSGNYIEVPFADTTLTDIRAVRAVLAYGTEATGSVNNAATIIMVDTTEVPILGSSASPVNYSPGGNGPKYADVIVPPPVGGWTLDAVNALVARIGYSTDVVPQPRWYAVMLEVDIAAGSDASPGPAGALAAASVAVSQFLRPISITGSSGTWTGTYADIAEATPDDTTAIVSPANPTSSVYEEVKLASGTAPGSTSGHIVHYRYELQGPGPMDLTVQLRNGSTVVASWTHTGISTTYTQANQTLTATQAAACAPYTDLRLRFIPNYTPAPNPPLAVLTLTRVDARTVSADWSSSGGGDGTLVNAVVNWGDGQATYTWPGTKSATHAYPATPTGSRTVTVTVTDTNALTATDTATFSVTSASPPVLGLARTRIDENSVTVDVTPTTAGANPIARHEITFGDGTSATLTEPTRTVRHDYPATPIGTKTITATVYDTAGLTDTGTVTFDVQSVSTGGDVVVYAVGDISAAGTKQTDDQLATAIANAGDMDWFLPLGDLQYPSGLIADYNTYYDASMGRFKTKTFPVPGNHEYDNPGTQAPGYSAYFGSAIATPNGAGKYYHHHDVGNWRIICLDSELLTGQDGVTSTMHDAQLSWLDARLAEIAGTTKGLIATWHRPRYNSASTHPSANGTTDNPYLFTSKLVDAKADLILTGHDHVYERFTTMGKTNNVLTGGPRHITVGTGGCGGTGYTVGSVETGSQVRIGFGSECFGALRLRLGTSDWSWSFLRSGGVANSDSGGPISIYAK